MADREPADRPLAVRALWIVAGFVCLGLAALGAILPGLPTTIFLIGATACFTRSSPRLEAWVLRLPGVGRAISDYRDGLGMSRRAKAFSVSSIVVFSAIAVALVSAPAVRVGVPIAAVVGTGVVLFVVPTRERVLAERARP